MEIRSSPRSSLRRAPPVPATSCRRACATCCWHARTRCRSPPGDCSGWWRSVAERPMRASSFASRARPRWRSQRRSTRRHRTTFLFRSTTAPPRGMPSAMRCCGRRSTTTCCRVRVAASTRGTPRCSGRSRASTARPGRPSLRRSPATPARPTTCHSPFAAGSRRLARAALRSRPCRRLARTSGLSSSGTSSRIQTGPRGSSTSSCSRMPRARSSRAAR